MLRNFKFIYFGVASAKPFRSCLEREETVRTSLFPRIPIPLEDFKDLTMLSRHYALALLVLRVAPGRMYVLSTRDTNKNITKKLEEPPHVVAVETPTAHLRASLDSS